ncbi:hypothetical protein [Neorhodopirellula lusitana]|uniref:hypothetical protein n=1 Tax=Neorhodopirellula lusitana TaxID=445327 RepID=UPI00384E1F8A
MPRKVNQDRYPELTFQERAGKPNRFRKRYKGKEYTWVFKAGEKNHDAYKRALADWKGKKAKIDRDAAPTENVAEAKIYWESQAKKYEEEISLFMKTLNERPRNLPDPEGVWERFRSLFRNMKSAEYYARKGLPIKQTLAHGHGAYKEIGHMYPWSIMERLGRGTTDPAKTLRASVDLFLKRKLKQHEDGKLSARRYGALKNALDYSCSVLGENTAVSSLDGLSLEKVREALEARISAKEIASSTGRDFLQGFKQLVRWIHERGTIERPRNLDSRDMNIQATPANPAAFTDDELTSIFGFGPSSRTKLYMLLMLNTGATQQDIADLTKDQFDAKAGTISRKRSKTSKHHSNSVPTVTWPLWPETLRLLLEERDSKADQPLLLCNEVGGPLKSTTINADGEVKTIDNIKTAYDRLRRKMRKKDAEVKKPLKVFRSTASSKLESNAEHARYTQHFLAHSGRTVADRHYVVVDQTSFNRAVFWLGQQWSKITGVE